LVYKTNALYLNHCTVPEFKKVFGDFDRATYADDLLAHFVINNDLGEMHIIFDNTNGLLLHIHLELFEELEFLRFLRDYGHDNYSYFEYMKDNHAVLNQNQVVRLSQKNNLVATLIFFNSNYAKEARSEFFEAVRSALENLKAEKGQRPDTINMSIQ